MKSQFEGLQSVVQEIVQNTLSSYESTRMYYLNDTSHTYNPPTITSNIREYRRIINLHQSIILEKYSARKKNVN